MRSRSLMWRMVHQCHRSFTVVCSDQIVTLVTEHRAPPRPPSCSCSSSSSSQLYCDINSLLFLGMQLRKISFFSYVNGYRFEGRRRTPPSSYQPSSSCSCCPHPKSSHPHPRRAIFHVLHLLLTTETYIRCYECKSS